MSGITGLGTTYDLPNFTGPLMGLTPEETPFLSSIGGLSNGGQCSSTEFEWGAYDLREPGQRARTEGATAPTAEERVRSSVNNVVQVHQEKVSVSYSKLAAVGQLAGIKAEGTNPVRDESTWQIAQMLKQMGRDVEWSFLNGTYHKPSDNTQARRTRGLRAAMTSNVIAKGTVIGTGLAVTASTDKITATAHGMNDGDQVVLTAVSGPTTIANDQVFFVVNKATNDFQIARTLGGAAVNLDIDGTVTVTKSAATDLSADNADDLCQLVWDNGGISESGTAALLANSSQKRKLTKTFADRYGKFVETSRNVGGVNLTTIETDFGVLNVMPHRMVPRHELILVSLEQCMPVFLETPGKGHFFAEPLAKTGASDDTQIYGEVGLAYGSEKAHGRISGLKI